MTMPAGQKIHKNPHSIHMNSMFSKYTISGGMVAALKLTVILITTVFFIHLMCALQHMMSSV